MKDNLAIRRIRNTELFQGCQRSELAQIARFGCELDVPANRTLCADGTPGLEFFVLLSGIVEVRTNAGRVALLHPGGWFGELALLENGKRRATVTTLSPCTLLVFGQREFASILDLFPDVEMKIRHRAASYAASGNPDPRPWYQPLGGGRSLGLTAHWPRT
jgi:CRP-like cAMP-binding protein